MCSMRGTCPECCGRDADANTISQGPMQCFGSAALQVSEINYCSGRGSLKKPFCHMNPNFTQLKALSNTCCHYQCSPSKKTSPHPNNTPSFGSCPGKILLRIKEGRKKENQLALTKTKDSSCISVTSTTVIKTEYKWANRIIYRKITLLY